MGCVKGSLWHCLNSHQNLFTKIQYPLSFQQHHKYHKLFESVICSTAKNFLQAIVYLDFSYYVSVALDDHTCDPVLFQCCKGYMFPFLQKATVKVSNVSLEATERDIKQLFDYCGGIKFVEMQRLVI